MEQMAKLLELLAEKLGTTAGSMFKILTEQAEIEAIRLYLGLIMHLLVTSVGTAVVIYSYLHLEKSDGWYGGVACGFVLFIIFGYIFLDTIADIITCKKNPQYFALNKIFDALDIGE